jgi:hypothetical protein
MSESSTPRVITRRAKSKTVDVVTMPDVLDGAEQQPPQQPPQQRSPKKVISKSISRASLSGAESGSIKGRRPPSKVRPVEDVGSKSDVPARPPPPPRPMTDAEREVEDKILQVIQNSIDKVKQAVTDKQVIFGKLQAELMRMLRVFQKLESLGDKPVVDAVEADANVSSPFYLMTLSRCSLAHRLVPIISEVQLCK